MRWASASHLYAIAYHVRVAEPADRIDLWPEALNVGEALLTLPLWLEPDLVVPLELEESYQAACAALRIANGG